MPLDPLAPSLYHVRKVHPSEDAPREVVYEATSDLPDAGWGLAYADITESVRHVHHHTHERYVHLVGPPLVVELDAVQHTLTVGATIDIVPGTAHKAWTTGDGPARVVCVTWPQWTAADHILLE